LTADKDIQRYANQGGDQSLREKIGTRPLTAVAGAVAAIGLLASCAIPDPSSEDRRQFCRIEERMAAELLAQDSLAQCQFEARESGELEAR
jgi:hypothetical protein